MKCMNKFVMMASWSALCLLQAPAFAEDLGDMKVQQQGEVRYVSGGVGTDQVEALKAAAKTYNLRMMFSLASGEYLSDVKVNVRDAKGKTVLETVSAGPYLYVAIPTGTYKVTAEALGAAVTKTANVSGSRGASLHFAWKAPKEALE